MRKDKILVIGANGQIGIVLTHALREIYGNDNVLATDIRTSETLYHLAAILSANGEKNPRRTWDINMNGLFNILEVAKEFSLNKVFFPSSIAVFGTNTPKEKTPQFTFLDPSTVYGISKAAGENWCQYYFDKYQLDVRSIRYPGVISYQSMPGGGTTDYAVDIFHKAVQGIDFDCFLSEETSLPMIYMPDAIRATLELMEAPREKIKVRSSYNLAAMSFSPLEIVNSIQQHFPNFKVNYNPDFRQSIADSWPASIDDSEARNDWNWKENYNINEMTKDMIIQLSKKYNLVL
jgi:threonine 3-dehydrogenase